MKNIISNLVLTFLTGMLVYYVITRTITVSAVLVSLAATGVIALGYLIIFLIKKNPKVK
ncbi:hypothetical protein D3C80_1937950 [compost metagenome]